jgi:beta-lactamase class A
MIVRREVLAAGIAAAAWPVSARASLGTGAETAWMTLDKASGRVDGANTAARMPMCSSFKWLLAAAVLARVDRGHERLDRPVAIARGDLLPYAPVVERALGQAVGGALTVAALCEGAVALSDNAAANLLLPSVGGPAGLTAWLRSIGDPVTRLDRIEPALNHVPAGDRRDTTSAAAMLRDLDRLLYGAVLSAASRARLMGWLLGCETGETRLKAGLPAGWRIAHKTGTFWQEPGRGERNASGDVGVLLPPGGRAPILVVAYTAGSVAPQGEIDRWFADLARRVTLAYRDAGAA